MIVQPRTQRGKSLVRLADEQREADQAPAWIKATFGSGIVDHEDLATLKTLGTKPDEVALECEVVSPDSGRWRTVYLHVPPEQILALLKLCRRAAAAQRAKALDA